MNPGRMVFTLWQTFKNHSTSLSNSVDAGSGHCCIHITYPGLYGLKVSQTFLPPLSSTGAYHCHLKLTASNSWRSLSLFPTCLYRLATHQVVLSIINVLSTKIKKFGGLCIHGSFNASQQDSFLS